MSEGWTVSALDAVDGYAESGRPRWHMIRSTFGIEAFGVNAWRATAAGQELIGDHDELGQGAGGHEELYVVLSGHATFTIDGESVDAPARTLLFVRDPALRRSAVAEEDGTTVFVVGARRGEAFTVSDWERSAEALRFWTTGDWESAIDVLRRQHQEHPANAGVLYNLACAEARSGRRDDAIAHLSAAIALEARFRESAAGDPDFDAIRDEAGFRSLVAPTA